MADDPVARSRPPAAGASVLLVHSPLVGPSTMAALAAAFDRRGFAVAVPDLTGVAEAQGPGWRWFVDRACRAAERFSSVVIVGHSGAGAMLPAIAERVGGRAAALVFVDAVVPPERGAHRTSAQLVAMLDRQTTGGLLAPWLTWWPPEVVEAMLVHPADRAALLADMPRLPRRFYDDDVPVPDDWSAGPCAYLQLSEAYDADRLEAEERGWPTAVIDSSHLGIHTEPDRVAESVGAILPDLDR